MTWLGNIQQHSKEAKARFKVDKMQRAAAEKSPRSVILSKKDIQGEWDAGRVLETTLGGAKRPLNAEDLAIFRRNMQTARARFQGDAGLTARQIINAAAAKPVLYRRVQPSGAKSDIDKAKLEISSCALIAANHGQLRFVTNASQDSKATRHHVVIQLNAFKAAARQLASVETSNQSEAKKVAAWLRKQKIAFDCDCERHRYFFRYVATIGGFAAGRQEWGYPKIRNPNLKGVACKHVLRVVSELEKSTTVLNFLAKHLLKAQNSKDAKARSQNTQKQAEQQAKKKAVGIETSQDRAQKRRAALERRAAQNAAKVQTSRLKKAARASKKSQADISGGQFSAADLIAQLKSMGLSKADILKALRD